MPEEDRRRTTPLRGPLARLDRDRETLAKAWLVQLIERASLDQIKDLPTDRIAAELPLLISDVLAAAGDDGDPHEMSAEARERAARLAELREDGGEARPADVARDVAAVQHVILDALRRDADELGGARIADLALSLSDAVAAVQAAAVDALVGRRSRELESQADSDPLTGLSNLRYLQQQVRTTLALHARYGQPFALLVLDIDGLKRVNDARGRSAGDRVLVQVALALRRTIRAVDVPARIGDDEFCVLVPNQESNSARALAERLSESIRAETGVAGEPPIGVSIGVVACPEHGADAAVLLEAADQAMYRAKAGGEAVATGDPTEPEITVERTS